MTPNLPSLDLTLINSWITRIAEVVWPVLAVLFGILVGAYVWKAFRDAVAGR